MTIFRRLVAVLIIAVLGIPLLIVMISVVGLIRGLFSPDFMNKLPGDIADRAPVFMEQVISEINRDETFDDEETKAWVKAMGEVETRPAQVLDSIGLTGWMKNDLTFALTQSGRIIRGETAMTPVWLDLRPLKTAREHPALTHYLKAILLKLPPCSTQLASNSGGTSISGYPYPAWPACCPPDPDSAAAQLHRDLFGCRDNMPDSVNLFNIQSDNFQMRHHPAGIGRLYKGSAYALLLLPLVILLIGSFIGAWSLHGTMRWLGISLVIGGGCSFMLSNMLDWLIRDLPRKLSSNCCTFNVNTDNLSLWQINSLRHLSEHLQAILDPLTSAANNTIAMVAISGIILFALSYFLAPESHPINQSGQN